MTKGHKIKFLLQNFLKGLLWMAFLGLLYWLFAEYIFKEDPEMWLSHFYSRPLLIYSIYVGSEVFFGLFPPEIFMIWAFNKGGVWSYVFNIAFFAGVSYGAGVMAYLVGRYMRRVVLYRYLSRKFFSKYWPLLRKFGSFLLIVAALTPLPWSTISLLIGSTEYPFNRFLLIALTRLLRFIVYGVIVYQGHVIGS